MKHFYFFAPFLATLLVALSAGHSQCADLTTAVSSSRQISEKNPPSRHIKRHLNFPPPKRIIYAGMSEEYNTARYEAALKADAALEMWARGISREEFGLDTVTGVYTEPFRDHQLIEQSIQIELNYWTTVSFASLKPDALAQFQKDLTRLSRDDVTNLVGKEWRRRAYRGDVFDIELEPLLSQSLVLVAAESIGGKTLREQVRLQMIEEYKNRSA